MKGLVRSAIVLSLLALTGFAQIPNRVAVIYLSAARPQRRSRLQKKSRVPRIARPCDDSLESFPRATVVAPRIDQHVVLP